MVCSSLVLSPGRTRVGIEHDAQVCSYSGRGVLFSGRGGVVLGARSRHTLIVRGCGERLVRVRSWGRCGACGSPRRPCGESVGWAVDPSPVAQPQRLSPRSRHLSTATQINVVPSIKRGNTINAGREFKPHRATATAILDRHDVPVQAHYMTPGQVDEAQTLYVSGHSLAEIGRHLGFDPTTIWNRLTRRGFHRRVDRAPARRARPSL